MSWWKGGVRLDKDSLRFRSRPRPTSCRFLMLSDLFLFATLIWLSSTSLLRKRKSAHYS